MSFPATYNINYYSGDTYEFVLVPKNADGTSFALSNYTCKMTIADQRGTTPTESHSVTPVIDSDNNTITCTIFPTVGAVLSASKPYYYDVEITNSSDSSYVYTIVQGQINVTEGVTS